MCAEGRRECSFKKGKFNTASNGRKETQLERNYKNVALDGESQLRKSG